MRLKGLQQNRKDLPMIVIDLGYSKSAKSCGIACDDPNVATQEMTFGNAIESTAALLRRHPASILVLEAPLSTFHNADGNPDIRGDFEKGRGWYHGAGASTLLAAIRFLTQVGRRIDDSHTVYLAEAFLSFKNGPTSHALDATIIHRDFWTTQPETLKAETESLMSSVDGVPDVRVFQPWTQPPVG